MNSLNVTALTTTIIKTHSIHETTYIWKNYILLIALFHIYATNYSITYLKENLIMEGVSVAC